MIFLQIILEFLELIVKKDKYIAVVSITKNILDITDLLTGEINFFTVVMINVKLIKIAWEFKKILEQNIMHRKGL